MCLESDLGSTVSLDGEWQFKLGDAAWRMVTVPSAWEASTHDKITEGPAIYRRAFVLPHAFSAGRYMLECDAISFAATVWVNGQHIGDHTGIWSRFQLDITPYVREGENELEIEVWKPGKARYMLRESLAGFLPDVATTFGGIWQGIRVRRFDGMAIADLRVQCDAKGVVRVVGRIVGYAGTHDDAPRPVATMWIEELNTSTTVRVGQDGSFRATLRVNGYERWSPQTPRTYMLVIEFAGACARRRVGFRQVVAKGEATLLNGDPIHFRGVLDWGWDEKQLCPTPSRRELLDAFGKARSLGFNMFKLCLFVPDEVTFDVADETGMLLWLELPMWLPNVTPAFRELALREYEAVLQRVHHHPSIVIVSTGCELNADAGSTFLAQLRTLVRRWLPGALHCDNSGSGEAYGGVIESADDFYDYHFYCEPHFFQPLVDHFRRAYQPDRPWIHGEFCDADTLRDFSLLKPKPFWLVDDLTLKRDELTWVRAYQDRLDKAGVSDGGKTLTQMARRQATELRKFVFEQTRREHATGGYVLTGWRDTPIATSGIVDDRGGLKFDPQEWRRFNGDRVLLMDRERRRRWVNGGDQPIYRDPFVWWNDELIEIHIALSNGLGEIGDAALRYQIVNGDGALVAAGLRACGAIEAASVNELAVVRLDPCHASLDVHNLTELCLYAWLEDGACVVAENRWRVWVVPRVDAVQLLAAPRLITNLDALALAQLRSGASLLLWQQCSNAFAFSVSFWRESIHCFDTDLLKVLSLSKSAYANLSLYSVATDLAIDQSDLAHTLQIAREQIRSLWRRFDARAMTWSEYVVEAQVGAGKLIVSTLRFAGGHGQQPHTIGDNPMGAWLLAHLLQMTQT